MDLPDFSILADFLALEPSTYYKRILLAVGAFAAAINIDKVIARVLGLAVLILAGGGFLIVGATQGAIGDILLGLASICAAGHAWWFTRM